MAYPASASTVLTLLGFCVSVIFIVFVCSRFACALARRRRRRRQRLPQYAASPYVFPFHAARHPAAAAAAGGGGAGAGLDPAAVAAFPTRAFAAAAAGPRDSGASDADAQ
ncbi:hypothetical protein PR202_gb00526 [Eleusine coracana subsp. coracana]|uniref:Uncharacterized protein n=1 Tax=Eleusine coracana subsp. coracana TaxID=191504 RepID=A0AAV5DUJ3_ELECO|nr:hypothetical protein PR202_gb00526 [Eleusine coracana subsp. coracana]